MLEVGIPNGTHGWLKIRAEMGSGGEVTAALSSASTSGQEMLRRELPSISSYLQQERLTVHTVVLDKVATEAGGSGWAQSGSHETTGDGQTRQERSQQGQWNGESRQEERGQQGKDQVWRFGEEAAGYRGLGEVGIAPQVTYSGGGSWLSVRA
jgi:hypothetical protein